MADGYDGFIDDDFEAMEERDEAEHFAVLQYYSELEYERRIFDSYPHDARWARAVTSLALYESKAVGRRWDGAYKAGHATWGGRAIP